MLWCLTPSAFYGAAGHAGDEVFLAEQEENNQRQAGEGTYEEVEVEVTLGARKKLSNTADQPAENQNEEKQEEQEQQFPGFGGFRFNFGF